MLKQEVVVPGFRGHYKAHVSNVKAISKEVGRTSTLRPFAHLALPLHGFRRLNSLAFPLACRVIRPLIVSVTLAPSVKTAVAMRKRRGRSGRRRGWVSVGVQVDQVALRVLHGCRHDSCGLPSRPRAASGRKETWSA